MGAESSVTPPKSAHDNIDILRMICHTGWIPELIYNLCHYDTNLKDKNSFACRLESQKNQIMWESGLGDFFFRASPTPSMSKD